MIKTIRLSDKTHKRLLKIQGEIQAESGEFTNMDMTIEKIIDSSKWKNK
jgi:hypothetical protein